MATQHEKVIGFNPNQVTFDEGLKRIQTAVKKLGLDVSKKILTSHDPQAEDARQLCEVCGSAHHHLLESEKKPIHVDNMTFISYLTR